jgi:hypothetical protein
MAAVFFLAVRSKVRSQTSTFPDANQSGKISQALWLSIVEGENLCQMAPDTCRTAGCSHTG